MHFESAEACINLFAEVENTNRNRELDCQLRCDNLRIYGQPNTLYSIHPKVRDPRSGSYFTLTLAEKFEPYFCDEVQCGWHTFLGELADQDPGTSSADRKSWEEVLRWILQSGLQGFGSGLGALQFANTMVLAGVATSPSPAFMAQWISSNRDYGAFAGLQLLGFKLRKQSSPATIRAAFLCFYYWLDHHLSDEDKHALGFGAIFVEQLLCKIRRWHHRMKEMGKLDLDVEAHLLFEGTNWEKGANLKDHTKFPIPSCLGYPISVFQRIVLEG
ncbi:hypothetical protein K438DRAFT_1641127 [Mycena galopus ATCC 62051]|nr:hypothetical protein K438DRAFT_1641127 [Mycena galopus ATCC 62051]